MALARLDPTAELGRVAAGSGDWSTGADSPKHNSPPTASQVLCAPVDLPLPRVAGGFRVVAADPPWRFKSNSIACPGKNAMRHYRCMTPAEIAALPVIERVANDAALFLWITGPFLAIGAHLPIMKAWGFTPSGMGFVWPKTSANGSFCIGTGFTTRKNCEFCVLGKRGRSVREHTDVRELIVAQRREHSRKPDEFFARVERYTSGPYLEMFARKSRPIWASWGLEATLFDEVAI